MAVAATAVYHDAIHFKVSSVNCSNMSLSIILWSQPQYVRDKKKHQKATWCKFLCFKVSPLFTWWNFMTRMWFCSSEVAFLLQGLTGETSVYAANSFFDVRQDEHWNPTNCHYRVSKDARTIRHKNICCALQHVAAWTHHWKRGNAAESQRELKVWVSHGGWLTGNLRKNWN